MNRPPVSTLVRIFRSAAQPQQLEANTELCTVNTVNFERTADSPYFSVIVFTNASAESQLPSEMPRAIASLAVTVRIKNLSLLFP